MSEEALIEAVKAHRELYDMNHNNYMKVKLKNRIWNQIAKQLHFKDGEEAKNLWLKLRASYRDARRRQMKCIKSGTAVESIKPWRFQKRMSFLEPYMLSGTRGNYDEGSLDDDSYNASLWSELPAAESDEIRPDYAADNEAESQLCSSINTQLGDDGNNCVEQPIIILDTIEAGRNTSSAVAAGGSRKCTDLTSMVHKKAKTSNDMSNLVVYSEERSQERAEDKRVSLKQSNTLDDPLYSFFISMYQSTKAMPPTYQHMVKGQVFQVVSDAEAAIMNMTVRQAPTTFSFSRDSAVGSSAPISPYSPSHQSPHASPAVAV